MKNLVYSAVALAAIIVVAEAQTAFLATLNNAQISYLSSEEGLNAMITCYQTRNDPACSDLVLRTLAEFPERVRSNCKPAAILINGELTRISSAKSAPNILLSSTR
nr:uncharacterized protein LOC128697852 [Cherax quadricarinatus]